VGISIGNDDGGKKFDASIRSGVKLTKVKIRAPSFTRNVSLNVSVVSFVNTTCNKLEKSLRT
jgi:hypothetical protein